MSQSHLPKDFLWGFATARYVIYRLSKHTPPRNTGAVPLSYTEVERTVTKSKAHRTKTAAQIPSGTLSVASLARLLAEILETWPAIPTTAQMKILTS
jgi:hypothetical protein